MLIERMVFSFPTVLRRSHMFTELTILCKSNDPNGVEFSDIIFTKVIID